MEWLTMWLKKVILLVLLAAFLDLILPNTSLQRYVKMVMGLIILLTILTPVFTLFQLSPDELALKISRYQASEAAASGGDEWRSAAARLGRQQDKQVEEYVERQMEALIREQVGQDFGVEVASVDVAFARRGDDQPEIDWIRVRLGESQARENSGIQPVKPVQIEIGRSGGQQAEQAVEAAVRPDDEPLSRRIAQAVARNWNVEVDRVEVVPEKADRG